MTHCGTPAWILDVLRMRLAKAWKRFWMRIYGKQGRPAPDTLCGPTFSYHVVPFSLWIAAWCWAIAGPRRRGSHRAHTAQQPGPRNCKLQNAAGFDYWRLLACPVPVSCWPATVLQGSQPWCSMSGWQPTWTETAH